MKHPLDLPESASKDEAVTAYSQVAGSLYDALELVDTLQQALGDLLDNPTNARGAANQFRLRYLLENAVELLDEHQFGGPHES